MIISSIIIRLTMIPTRSSPDYQVPSWVYYLLQQSNLDPKTLSVSPLIKKRVTFCFQPSLSRHGIWWCSNCRYRVMLFIKLNTGCWCPSIPNFQLQQFLPDIYKRQTSKVLAQCWAIADCATQRHKIKCQCKR